ncbi:MAG: ABC transporter related [Thermotoga sp. 50_1627]|uniref:ABC transporter n=1 Tax=Pseudothermotoga hypogea DSM 11164 = NBRC 106472 TaxID=1123384 RepID=A0A0X1KTF0_9THEM|nr:MULTISPECIES: ABC transporter ATP-binding protein [Pseudothermotoga]KUK02754.1 MAG: ABC transporter related [Thermotoga sp. 50_64]KUK23995.1 MAG: ABC transporter related [Thermotoga sp. 50_1627]AJC74466.1 ABC transporter [Pseudothermotoga hypogea DSM 11164 = NBRC 106472]MDI6863815.1 ABC transporter ATP-binding protein [Pseudothermotoga sp.]HBT38541.1 ABC transporter ATP-binding protein [Pseudothermotoga sp.]
MSVIETRNLCKYYGKHRGIVDVSFSVEEGEIFGFIGPNGAGKTTTIRILLGLIFPTSGTARIFGKDCTREGHEIRKEIGYVPGEVNYYSSVTVDELLNYSASFYDRVDKKYIKELCEIFELDPKKKFRELSTGNKKKVAIVQALLHKPKLLICDEPTNGLDPIMQNRLFEIIRELKGQGTTIFFSSHILSEVQKLCDEFAMIKEGKVVKTGKIEQLAGFNYKSITLQSRQIDELERTLKIPHRRIDDSTISFKYSGDINELLKKLSEIQIENIWIEDPSLEELFLSFYEEGER